MKKEKYKLAGKEYDVIGYVGLNKQDITIHKKLSKGIPLIDVPLMSNERWNELCRKNKKTLDTKNACKGK